MSDDAFDLAAVFSNVPVDEDTQMQDEKMKKKAEKRAKADREEKVNNNVNSNAFFKTI